MGDDSRTSRVDRNPQASLTAYLKELGEKHGAQLASHEYEVRFVMDPPGAAPLPGLPSFHLIPRTPGAATFYDTLEGFVEEPEDFILLEEDERKRVFTARGHEGRFRLQERWRQEGEATVVTWEVRGRVHELPRAWWHAGGVPELNANASLMAYEMPVGWDKPGL